MVLEGDANAVSAEVPIESMGAGGERGEESDRGGKGRQFGKRNGREAGVVEGTIAPVRYHIIMKSLSAAMREEDLRSQSIAS